MCVTSFNLNDQIDKEYYAPLRHFHIFSFIHRLYIIAFDIFIFESVYLDGASMRAYSNYGLFKRCLNIPQ